MLLAKPKLDTREVGVMHSRIGLEQPCIYVEDLVEKSLDELNKYDCIIVDEAQFCKKEDVKFFTRLVDDLDIPVICYGLRTDFQMNLFEGSMWLLAWADKIEELKTVCCAAAAHAAMPESMPTAIWFLPASRWNSAQMSATFPYAGNTSPKEKPVLFNAK